MKEKWPIEELNKEYEFLMDSQECVPPEKIGALMKRLAHEDLNPAAWKVFCKLFAIHFVSGVITLFFCPQLGFGIHGAGSLLSNFLLSFGEVPCTVVCGALFLGTTGLIAAILLRSTEIRAIKKTKALQWALLSFVSLGFFLSVNEAEMHIPFGLALVWVVSSLIGGLVSFQFGWQLRRQIVQYLTSP